MIKRFWIIYAALVFVCGTIAYTHINAQSNGPPIQLLYALWQTCFNDDWIVVKSGDMAMRITCVAEQMTLTQQ